MVIKQLSLFNDDECGFISSTNNLDTNIHKENDLGILHHKLCESLSFTGRFQMPIVKKVECEIPKNIIAFYRTRSGLFKDCIPHFYTNDHHIECLWSQPYRMVNVLRESCSLAIGPDFSVYGELLFPQKLWNIFRNKLIVAFWQQCDLISIPNISWVDGEYDLSFDGWPRNSVVAVNSTGIGRSNRCKASWTRGYKEMIKRLNPVHILRYGAKQDGEI